jgi:hypothetical protein
MNIWNLRKDNKVRGASHITLCRKDVTQLAKDCDKRQKAGVESTLLRIGEKNACALKTSSETRKKETSHAINCNTSRIRIERNVKTENTQQVKIVLKLPKTVYGVPVTVTSPLLFFFLRGRQRGFKKAKEV